MSFVDYEKLDSMYHLTDEKENKEVRMTKTKRQLRAEAVERLRKLDGNTCSCGDIIACSVDCFSSFGWKEEIAKLIDLLTDDCDIECYECSKLAELRAENSQLRVKCDELQAKVAIIGGEKYHTLFGMTFDEIRELKAKLAELQAKLDETKSENDAMYARVNELYKEVDRAEAERDALQAKVDELKAENNALRNRCGNYNDENIANIRKCIADDLSCQ